MSTEDIAIKVDHVSKDFILPHEKISTLKGVFTSLPRLHARTREMQHALRDINFEVKKGEFFGVVGRNGSGKSTLLKILAGIYQPTKGSVTVNGKLVPFIELGVGFNAELTGRENVYLNGAMLGFSPKEIDEMYDEIVGFAELEKFMDQKLKNYSSGMQVRLAFSMATRAKADILLVDEVLAVGDADFQRKCYNYFRTLKKNKKTVIFVSHEMTAVREYCDRAVLIEDSRIVEAGTADKVASQYTRMFLEQKDGSKGRGEDTNRWGEGKIKYKRISIKSRPEEEDLFIECEVTSQADEPQQFSLGFRIRSEAGMDIFGVNSRLLNIKDMPIKPGESQKFTWKAPNILSDGKYSMVNSIADNDGTIQDYIEDEHTFEVRKAIMTGYPVQPAIELLEGGRDG